MAPSKDLPEYRGLNTADLRPLKAGVSAEVKEIQEILEVQEVQEVKETHETQEDQKPEHILPPGHPATLVLNPALITQDFDLLRFAAAAALQLPPAHTTPDPADTATYSTSLISSPYNIPGHYLTLSTLTPPSLLLALALTTLAPARPDYATAPYPLALNFPTVFSTLRSLITTTHLPFPATSFYVVTFHSVLAPTASQSLLHTLDSESHREACASGGLLKYWFGKADLGGDRRNLATCFWAGREEARRGGRGEWHAKARRAGGELYEGIVFGTWRLWVGEGGRGWGLEAWEE